MSIEPTTNFKDSNGVDLGKKLVTKDYLISVYPEIGQQIGIPPELWTWGRGNYGQLGNATITNTSTPITTSAGETNWKQVSGGPQITTAIKTDGTLWSWGYGSLGRLGNNQTTNKSTPVTTFAGGNDWKQVSAGAAHVAAIKTDGTLWVWGLSQSGRLGNGVITGNILTPITTFSGGTNWRQVSAGSAHTSAIKTDGTLWVWGSGSYGRLGNNATANVSTPVTTFAGGNDWKQVSAGGAHQAAIKNDGTLWSWGNQFGGRLGNGITSNTNAATPVTTFAGGTNWKQVNAGYRFTVAIKTDGTLWTWGQGTNGALGDNQSATNKSTPITTFAGGNNWKQVSTIGSSTSRHTTAIKTDGTLWSWGTGIYGRLGNGSTTDRLTPVTTFAGGTNWKQVGGGQFHSTAIKSVDFTAF